MTWWQGAILGVVQGLTEFLPVSSSAHLALLPWAARWDDPGLAFDVALHLGTLIALVLYFRAEWIVLAKAGLSMLQRRKIETPADRLLTWVVLATIPAAAAGVILKKWAESAFRDPRYIGVALAVMGVILWLVDRFAKQERKMDQMGWRSALAIGVAQVFALFPGVSRSGSTITAARALRFDREASAVFSFMLTLPIIAGAVLLEGRHAVRQVGDVAPLVAGLITSAVSGWLAIKVLLNFVIKHSYGAFAVYRVVLAAAVIWWTFVRP